MSFKESIVKISERYNEQSHFEDEDQYEDKLSGKNDEE
jgi:hypothetical protein